MGFILLPPLLFVLLALLFEGAFHFTKERLTSHRTESAERTAKAFKLILFQGEKPLWTLWGERGDFSRGGFIEVIHFRGENRQNHLVVSSNHALFEVAKKLIHLKGHVVVLYGERGQKVRIETDAATVDLNRGVIYGNGKVVVREPGRILVGEGFKYNIKTGKFIILRDVQSFLVAP